MARLFVFAKSITASLIIVGAAFFFWKAFHEHLDALRAHSFTIDRVDAAIAFAVFMGSHLLAARAWQVTMNAMTSAHRLTFSESIAACNTSCLTKYVPGKVWSYIFQLHWLDKFGFSRALAIVANLANLYVTLLVTTCIGLLCLVISPPHGLSPLVPLCLLLAVIIGWIVLHAALIGRTMRWLAKRYYPDIVAAEIGAPVILRLCVIHLAAAILFGLGVYWVYRALGYEPQGTKAYLIVGAGLLADVVGFVVFVAPGGLGVRETTMYFMLQGVGLGSLTFTVPLATRLVTLIADLVMGVFALMLLRRMALNRRPS